MAIIKKIKEFFGFQLPSTEISPNREDEIINNVVALVSRSDMELPALLMLSSLIPLGTILSQLALYPIAPIFELVGIKGYQYAAFVEKKDNLRRLVKKIEQKYQEKDKKGFW